MSAKSRQWQARIEIGSKLETLVLDEEDAWSNEKDWQPKEIVYVYGASIDKLREAARKYLLEKKPSVFGNRGDQIAVRFDYACVYKASPFTIREDEWLVYKINLNFKQRQNVLEGPGEIVGSFEDAVNHFVEFALIPEKGPDYQSRAIVGDRLQLPFIEKILREAEEHPINDLLKRGWHIIALEYKGELSMTGELMNRKAIFVMGHADAQVATLTLNSGYFTNDLSLG
jgi:hypothetical protein